MHGWRIPTRAEILPVSGAQSCAVCGARDWSWLYLLLNAPDWVQRRGWFASWFVVMCDGCQAAWEQGSEEVLRVRWALNDAHTDGPSGPGLDEWRDVVTAMQSEPPMTRAAATGA